MAEPAAAESLLETPLHGEHAAASARLVPFAGYAMPVQYATGILAEHLWTREHAGLFEQMRRARHETGAWSRNGHARCAQAC